MSQLVPAPGSLPYCVVHADNGFFACFPNGAVRRISNHEIVYLRDESKVRTYRFAGEWKRGAIVSRHLFNTS